MVGQMFFLIFVIIVAIALVYLLVKQLTINHKKNRHGKLMDAIDASGAIPLQDAKADAQAKAQAEAEAETQAKADAQAEAQAKAD